MNFAYIWNIRTKVKKKKMSDREDLKGGSPRFLMKKTESTSSLVGKFVFLQKNQTSHRSKTSQGKSILHHCCVRVNLSLASLFLLLKWGSQSSLRNQCVLNHVKMGPRLSSAPLNMFSDFHPALSWSELTRIRLAHQSIITH